MKLWSRKSRWLKRLVKLGVSLAVRGWDVARAGLLGLNGRKPAPVCVVIYYHAIPAEDRERFARQMDELIRLAEPIPCDFTEKLVPGHRYAAVTFDDGFVSVLDHGLPELEARRIPAALFVPTGFLGQPPLWVKDQSAPARKETVLSEDLLARLKTRALVAVGSHSVSHPDFLALEAEQARSEFCRSRQELERILGRSVTTFSFPYGKANDPLIALAREAGYQRVFTIEPRLALGEAAEFVVGRVEVDPRDWPIEFRLKLQGACRWQASLSRLKSRARAGSGV